MTNACSDTKRYVNMDSYALTMSREHACHQIQIVHDNTNVFVLLVHLYWKLRPLAAITTKRFNGKTIDINATAMALGDKCIGPLPRCMLSQVATVGY